MRNYRNGSTLAELVVACALFSVFMVVSIGMFTGMTKIVRTEQQPADRLLEARTALLHVVQRIRNCEHLVEPAYRSFLTRETNSLLLRDSVLQKTVHLRIEEGAFKETFFSLDYDPDRENEPLDENWLIEARDFSVVSGGWQYPTRVTIRLTTAEGLELQATTNFREAL
ncbi:MAG: hypothetical protein KC800_32765 [Candidatus Eremiobacteraeota bacterium]|nr:hypothetical protein [Candidatus Eremiobacteraeota bacterium]